MMQFKRCTKCGQEVPVSQFSKRARSRDGLRSECKTCQAECRRRYYAEHRGALQNYSREYHAANAESRKEYHDRWYKANTEAQRSYQLLYREVNAEAVRERERLYRTNNAEARREQGRRYYAEHIEARREHDRQYRQTPHGKAKRRAGQLRRRVREAAAPGRGVTSADIQALIAGQTDRNGRLHCWWCNAVIEDGKWHVDHRIALAVGGAHDPTNCCLSCAGCNLSKHTRGPEWAGRLL
jgi:5-methylcytosine-specific restriction endonuclease McrA